MHRVTEPSIMLASLVAVAALGGCGGQAAPAATSTTATAGAGSATAPATSSGTTAAASQSPVSPSASAAAPAKSAVDPFVTQASALMPRATPRSVLAVRTMICMTLDADPTPHGVTQIVSGLVEQSGLAREQATRLVALSVTSGCAKHAALVR